MIFVADDDEEDCFLPREALEASGSKASFVSVEDGVEFMDYLLKRTGSQEGGLPRLILLDLNMPRRLSLRSKPTRLFSIFHSDHQPLGC